MNSLGCHSSRRLPPSMMKLPSTLPSTSMEPMIDNMRSHYRLKRSSSVYRQKHGFLEAVAGRIAAAGHASFHCGLSGLRADEALRAV